MIKQILLAFIFTFFVTLASGEYYQYTDKNGKLSFTDDISNIPEDQMNDVKKIKIEHQKTEPIETASKQNKSTKTTPSPSSVKDGENVFQSTAIELDIMQAKLNEIRIILEDEKAAIEAMDPNNERLAYSVRIEALNWKISEYEKKLAIFNEQVEKFNILKKQKAEHKKE